MKSNIGNRHLLALAFKYEQEWTKIGYDKNWESEEVNLQFIRAHAFVTSPQRGNGGRKNKTKIVDGCGC